MDKESKKKVRIFGIASFLAGILRDKIGIFAPFSFSLFLSLLALLLLFNSKVIK
jgi:uncharacterized membrane-anchored protein